jgi:hypothetical protein
MIVASASLPAACNGSRGSAIACVAMVCSQTAHFAVLLLSLLEGREYVRQAHNRLVGG